MINFSKRKNLSPRIHFLQRKWLSQLNSRTYFYFNLLYVVLIQSHLPCPLLLCLHCTKSLSFFVWLTQGTAFLSFERPQCLFLGKWSLSVCFHWAFSMNLLEIIVHTSYSWDSNFFPPFILWVMEMNSCGPLKNWETESEVFNQNGASLWAEHSVKYKNNLLGKLQALA